LLWDLGGVGSQKKEEKFFERGRLRIRNGINAK